MKISTMADSSNLLTEFSAPTNSFVSPTKLRIDDLTERHDSSYFKVDQTVEWDHSLEVLYQEFENSTIATKLVTFDIYLFSPQNLHFDPQDPLWELEFKVDPLKAEVIGKPLLNTNEVALNTVHFVFSTLIRRFNPAPTGFTVKLKVRIGTIGPTEAAAYSITVAVSVAAYFLRRGALPPPHPDHQLDEVLRDIRFLFTSRDHSEEWVFPDMM